MKIKEPRVHHPLLAGSVGFVLLAASAGAAVALRHGPFHQVTGPGPGPIAGQQSPSISDPSGLALLARVQRAYRHAPGVELATKARSTSTRTPARRFRLRLQNGIVTAEAFLGPRGQALVAHEGGPTFSRAAGARCWRRLAPRNPRALVNIGGPFPENAKVIILTNNARARRLKIETHSAFWFLAGPVVPTRPIAPKSFLTLTLNPATYAIRSIYVRAPDPAVRATLAVTPLSTGPSLPSPTPTC
jgi:hypothetical protein